MGLPTLLDHLINFAAPALWLALLLPWVARLLIRKRQTTYSLPAQMALTFVAGLVILLLGLALFGQDGKMVTYLALVVTAATSQWLMRKG